MFEGLLFKFFIYHVTVNVIKQAKRRANSKNDPMQIFLCPPLVVLLSCSITNNSIG